MSFKYNFGILKNKPIYFKTNTGYIGGILQTVKTRSNQFVFVYKDKQLGVDQSYFKGLKTEIVNDCVVFNKPENDNLVNGLFGFTMFDTFGFPFELSEEILKESNLELDMEGIKIFRQLQKISG